MFSLVLCTFMKTLLLHGVVWFTLPMESLQSERERSSFLSMKRKLKRGVAIHPSTGGGGKFQRPRKGQVMDVGRHDLRYPSGVDGSSLVEQRSSAGSVEQRSRGGSIEQRSRGNSVERLDQAGMLASDLFFSHLLSSH